jgi:hypothetical protein
VVGVGAGAASLTGGFLAASAAAAACSRGALSRALGIEALFLGASLRVFLGADFLVDSSLLQGLSARVELTRGEVPEVCACRRGTAAGARARLLFLARSCERPPLLALDHDHVLAAMAEALLDVPGRFGALQAQRLASAGRGGLIRGFLGLTHACSDLALERGSLDA